MKKNVYLTGHSHIDAVWLWDIPETKQVCRETFKRILDILDKREDFVYMQSTAQFYRWMEDENPEIFERIKKHVENGKWEIVGGMWVESDCNLPSGESLVRQFLYGKKYFLEKFNMEINTTILPDTFGYAWTLPQIMKGSGIDYFLTSKINWETTLQFPYCLFWWVGPDGTKILSLATPTGYVNTTYEDVLKHVKMTVKMQDTVNDIFIPYGEGDHGGGLSHEMIEDVYKSDDVLNVKYCRIGEYFEKIKKDYSTGLPVFSDELYLKTHRGTYSSQGMIKKFNRKIECDLDVAEKLSVFSRKFGGFSFKNKIEKNWEKVLLHQFHDDLPGSSITKVYEDDKRDFKLIQSSVNDIIERSLNQILKNVNINKDNSIIVFNPHAFSVNSEVKCEIPDDVYLQIIDNGNIVDSVFEDDAENKYIVFSAENLPPLGYKIFKTVTADKISKKDYEKLPVENDFYSFSFSDKTGLLETLYDKENKIKIFKEKSPMELLIYEDKTPLESAWNINLGEVFSLEPCKIEVEENNSYRTVVKSSYILDKEGFEKSTVEFKTIINNTIKRILFKIDVDWKEKFKTLKLSFNFNTENRNYDFEIPYGSISRKVPTCDDITAEEKAKWEVPGQKWVSVLEGDHRISLLNDSKYGFDTKNGKLKITLLRSAKIPKPLNEIFEKTEPEYTDRDKTQINLSIIETGREKNEVYKLANSFNELPLSRLVKTNSGILPEKFSFLEFSGENSILTTIKESEDSNGIILRFFETEGKEGSGKIRFNRMKVEEAFETNLIEKKEKELRVENGEVNFDISPYQIKTIYIR